MTESAITTSRPTAGRWPALALVVAAQFMVVLDISIVNVALAAIKSDLHFAQANLQWVISAYAIVFGGFLLLGGRLADLLGRRRLFVAGVALFTISSALCGLAWSALSPRYLRESRAGLEHRHFDFAGATSVTASLMVLVYALTQATQRGWGSATTVTLLVASAVLAVAFVAIERRASSPLLPFRVFR